MKTVFFFGGVYSGSAVFKAYDRLFDLFEKAVGPCQKTGLNEGVLVAAIRACSILRSAKWVVAANIWQVLLLSVVRFGRPSGIIFWVQGLVAEESYVKRRSNSRFWILSLLEGAAFRCVSKFIFVSEYMRLHYSMKYSIEYGGVSVVIPCISDLVAKDCVVREEKSFCYLGGMAAWQRFDLVVKLMNKVSEFDRDVRFYIATQERELCSKMLAELGSDTLRSVTTTMTLSDKAQVEEFLSGMQFGFLLRDDILVNHVSSPIKLAEYLSCGVRVITRKALKSYTPILGAAGLVIDDHEMCSGDFVSRLTYDGPEASISLYEEVFSSRAALKGLENFLHEMSARH